MAYCETANTRFAVDCGSVRLSAKEVAPITAICGRAPESTWEAVKAMLLSPPKKKQITGKKNTTEVLSSEESEADDSLVLTRTNGIPSRFV